MGKFALRGLAQSLARELGPQGIHVAHIVVDGAIRSAGRPDRADVPDATLDPDEIARTYLALLAQGRSAWSGEVAVRPWTEPFCGRFPAAGRRGMMGRFGGFDLERGKGADDRERESRAALERVRRETETVGSSALARMSRRAGEHFSAADAEREGLGSDPIEVWGRRIGRALSVLLAAALIWTLGQQLGWW